MSALVERVRRTLRRHDLLPPGTTVIAAVSGGSDSVALVHLLSALQRSMGFRLLALAHVHHGLRGEDADRDEAFCVELADRLGLTALVRHVDVRAAAQAGRRSLEDAARELRYEALSQSADQVGAGRVAVGHTLEDQAETVLLKLARGAGLRGLAGIHPRRGSIVRPLLECRRSELRTWLEEQGVPFVEDASNEDRRHARNRLRHDVLPALRQACGASVDAVLARVAEVARVEDAFLAALAETASAGVLRDDGPGVRIDLAALERQAPALQRRIVLAALQRAGVRHVGLAATDAVTSLGREGGGLDLPGGVRADRIGRAAVLLSRAPSAAAPASLPFRYRVPVPGRVRLAECGSQLQAEVTSPEAAAGGSVAAVLDAASVTGGLFVRTWRPGDWLRPVGLGGRKKVQDVFVDRKVPRADRGRLPLVVDADDRVIWVPGHALDEAYRVTASTCNVVVLVLTELGGPE